MSANWKKSYPKSNLIKRHFAAHMKVFLKLFIFLGFNRTLQKVLSSIQNLLKEALPEEATGLVEMPRIQSIKAYANSLKALLYYTNLFFMTHLLSKMNLFWIKFNFVNLKLRWDLLVSVKEDQYFWLEVIIDRKRQANKSGHTKEVITRCG